MRRAIVLVALALLCGCSNPPKPAPMSHGIYLSPENLGQVSLKLPSTWELREGLESVPLVALHPVEKGQTFRESLTFVAVPLAPDESPSQFITRSLEDASKQLQGFQALPSQDPERWAYYEHEYGGQTIDVMAYFLTRERTGYIFAFSCARSDVATAKPLFEAIARTISVEPEVFAQMKDLRDALQKHDLVTWEIIHGIKK